MKPVLFEQHFMAVHYFQGIAELHGKEQDAVKHGGL